MSDRTQKSGSNSGKNAPKGNRFVRPTGRQPYSSRSEYLKAMSEQLTPDLWDAIVTRAIHDAAFGSPQSRAKARDWFAKYILPFRMEVDLHKESNDVYGFLAEIYNIFHQGSYMKRNVEETLGITLGAMTPEERASLRAVLAIADSPEIQQFWDESRTRRIEKEEREEQEQGGGRTV